MSIQRMTVVTALTLLVVGCGNTHPGYEVITPDDSGVQDTSPVDAQPDTGVDVPMDVPTDVPMDAPVDVAPDGLICTAGLADCDHNMANGCESTLATDLSNCGACAHTCPSGPNSTAQCTSGTCSIMCASGFADCDSNPANGCEVALNTTTSNCGSCGHVCAGAANATPSCTAGTCHVVCNAGFTDCNGNPGDGCEINTATDPANCNTCGNACSGATNATPRCTGSVCSIACLANYANCDGVNSNGCEINVQVSLTNCGTCGTVCGGAPNAAATCTTGVCGIRCNTNYLNCDGDTVNGCETMATSCP